MPWSAAMAKATDKDSAKKPLDLAERLNDPAFRAQIEEGLKNMPPEKAAELVEMLETSLRRRKVELWGYIGAAVVMLVGMVVALYIYGSSDPDSFRTWIFLIPMGLAGLVMWIVGRWADADRKKAKARRQGL
jgi:hypothetical protein